MGNETETKKIRIIFPPSKENPFAVLYKPHGLPSAPLNENDAENALSQAYSLMPEIGVVEGRKKIEKGLLHRLDTATAGLLLVAATQECYEKMIEAQKSGAFHKFYKAKCDAILDNASRLKGFPPFQCEQFSQFLQFAQSEKTLPRFENARISEKDCGLDFPAPFTENNEIKIKSCFRSFGSGNKEVRPVTENSGKAALRKTGKPVIYETSVKIKSIDKGKKQCETLCEITLGFRHQVRSHLAWLGLPVVNDRLYNSKFLGLSVKSGPESGGGKIGEMEFEAVALEFPHPVTRENVTFKID